MSESPQNQQGGHAAAPAPVVGIVMGSDSDWPVMREAARALEEFGIPYEADVVSAHRMPDEMIAYGQGAAGRGLRVVIAGAGGAAHLPGMLASVTPLPVVGLVGDAELLEGTGGLAHDGPVAVAAHDDADDGGGGLLLAHGVLTRVVRRSLGDGAA